MSDNKLALVFFDIGFAMMLISMVTGPFDITDWSLTSGAAACLFALASIYLAFQNLGSKPSANITHTENGGHVPEKKQDVPNPALNR